VFNKPIIKFKGKTIPIRVITFNCLLVSPIDYWVLFEKQNTIACPISLQEWKGVLQFEMDMFSKWVVRYFAFLIGLHVYLSQIIVSKLITLHT